MISRLSLIYHGSRLERYSKALSRLREKQSWGTGVGQAELRAEQGLLAPTPPWCSREVTMRTPETDQGKN